MSLSVQSVETNNDMALSKPAIQTVEDLDNADVKELNESREGLTAELAQETKLSLWQTIRQYPKASLLAACAAFSAVSDGYQYALPGSIVANKGFIRQMGFPDATGTYKLDPQHVAAWGGVYTAAYTITLLLVHWPIDKFGRRWMIFSIQIGMAIACILEMFATNWTHWLGAKILNGVSVGMNQMTLMTYIGEIAPVKARGALLSTYAFWWSAGNFACSIALQILAGRPDIWRRAVYSQWVFTGVALLVWLVLPESPRWLCEKGDHERARGVLKQMNGGVKGYDVDIEYAILEREVTTSRAMAEEAKDVSVKTLFKGTNLRRTYISFMPFAWQQWAGSPLISAYLTYFYQLAGVANPFLGNVINRQVTAIKLFGLFISPFPIEWLGRRRLLLIGGVGCSGFLYALGGLVKSPSFVGGDAAFGAAMVAMTGFWTLSYGSTLSPVGYVYLGETSTTVLRGKTTSIAAAGTGFLNLIVNYCTPLMLAAPNFGPGATALFYATTAFVGLVIVYFTIPETKGRSYEELDELFERSISARKFRTTETTADMQRKEGARRFQV